MANLTSLSLLDLGGNNLTGSMPLELLDLVNLEFLALEGNELLGPIPDELLQLPQDTMHYSRQMRVFLLPHHRYYESYFSC